MKKKIKILIEGPTGIGKTRISLELAKIWETDIISADSRAFYYEMKIGTARPEVEENGIYHHLVAFLTLSEQLSVGDYLRKATSIIQNLETEEKVILVAGGSPLYVRSLLYGLTSSLPPTTFEVRAHYQKLYRLYGNKYLYRILKKVDLKRANQLNENDYIRVSRALEIFRMTRKPMSQLIEEDYFTKNIKKKTEYFKFCLVAPRETIYKRINERVDLMVKAGLLEEAQKLFQKYGYSNPILQKTIGYQELIPYFKGKISQEEAIEKIKTNTRRLAKRQLVWYKRENFIPLEINEKNFTKIRDKIVKFIKQNTD